MSWDVFSGACDPLIGRPPPFWITNVRSSLQIRHVKIPSNVDSCGIFTEVSGQELS